MSTPVGITEKPRPVTLVAGTASWSTSPEGEAIRDEILEVMRGHNITKLDTARRYGTSELALGSKGLASEFQITTKFNAGPGSGKRDAVLASAKTSFDALKVNKVEVYLLHAPDETTPIEETAHAIQVLYEEGRFKKFGLSNFSTAQTLEWYNYAKENNLVLPTVFQSQYSLAVRANETLLFPTLRKLGFHIQAYSPLAAGFLSKTPSDFETAQGRWDPSTLMGKFHRELFYRPSYLKLLEEFGKLSEQSGVSRVGLAYRWVAYHSVLKQELGDEMILGASSGKQFQQTVEEIEKGPLEHWVAEKIEELWDLVKDDPVDNVKAFKAVFGGV
ncbi:aldehyde reductase [Phlyctema vagabunda]|uniref:Aldehyde reductase n=1 Tax=Phlyctema vagabunda TaxID=108571 RepID=A0ABR4PI10_9HELO